MNNFNRHKLHYLFIFVIAAFLAACASMGRPEGGPRDIDPPVFIRSNPMPGQTNVTTNKIRLDFDENVQLKDIMTKVVISPSQQLNPTIRSGGKSITVELKDSLKENTTYTIDFTDAIADLNEGNPIDGFAFAFSTGETIDSLQISGMVLQAENLEPAQGMLVGVYSNLSDTAIRTLPFERITRTNQYGQYTLRNLKEGQYRIFAINDLNRDNRWDRSEDIAFYDILITPTAQSVMHQDTLKAFDGTDSIVDHMVTQYGPNDILLTWFNENYTPLYLAKNERNDRARIYLEFSAPVDSMPELKILNGQYKGRNLRDFSFLNSSQRFDSIEYWIADSTLIMQDSITLEARYLRTDTLEQISWTTDTLYLNVRVNNKKKEEAKKKDNTEENDSLESKIKFINFKVDNQRTQEIYLPLNISSATPIKSIDQNGVHLEIQEDSVWIPLQPPLIQQRDSLRPMKFFVDYEWESGGKYRFIVDSAAVVDIYGMWNNTLSHEFTVRNEGDYSSITFNISGLDEPAVVQLLSTNDQPLRQQPVVDGKAVFLHLNGGTYYARLYVDRNENMKYDSGSFTDSIQPEDVYYYPKKIPLKEKWDAVLTWDVNELPVDLQKPLDIKKNKPKPKPGELPEEDLYDEEEEDDTFYAPGSIDERYNNRPSNNTDRINRTGGGLRKNNQF